MLPHKPKCKAMERRNSDSQAEQDVKLTPEQITRLVQVATDAQAAGHGGKGKVYARACDALGCSLPTLHRWLAQVRTQSRKQRSDAGSYSLCRKQAEVLSAMLMEGYRQNDKKIQSVKLALKRLRANQPDFACVLDTETGELVRLSESACIRALRGFDLHPDQLRAPSAAQQLASKHPNHVWQIDASISTLYYVPDGGVQDMSKAEFYKNKPDNYTKIRKQRLTRYVVTDHTSGAIFVHYVRGVETAENMAEAFLHCIQQRDGQMFYGVPFMLMMDPGSAGVSGAFGNLLRRLQVQPLVNKVGNARAKGQVENAHNIVECDFESGFKLADMDSLETIQQAANGWMQHFNAVEQHTRHGRTRYAKWCEIKQEQLRLAPPMELCRELLTHRPVERKVNNYLQVSFAGKSWDVAAVEGVAAHSWLLITHNPYNPAAAYAVLTGEDGHEQLVEIPEVQHDAHGFATTATVIGEQYKQPKDTLADTNRKAVERLAMGAATDAEAEARRKLGRRKGEKKAVAFDGAIDPFKHHEDLPTHTQLPKRGVGLEIAASTTAQERTLNYFETAKELAGMGCEMTREKNALIKKWYPDGEVPEADLMKLKQKLETRSTLQVVGGTKAGNG